MADSIVLDYDPVCLTVPFGEQHERVFFSGLGWHYDGRIRAHTPYATRETTA